MPADAVVPGDAFGAALMECWEGGARAGLTSEIVERDDGLIQAADIFRYFAAYAAWHDTDRWACDSLAGRVLDVGAGAGRHSLYLQERGCDVTALDPSPLAGTVCSRRGIREVFAGTVDELAATAPQPFDAFVLLGNNVGLLRTGTTRRSSWRSSRRSPDRARRSWARASIRTWATTLTIVRITRQTAAPDGWPAR